MASYCYVSNCGPDSYKQSTTIEYSALLCETGQCLHEHLCPFSDSKRQECPGMLFRTMSSLQISSGFFVCFEWRKMYSNNKFRDRAKRVAPSPLSAPTEIPYSQGPSRMPPKKGMPPD